MSLKAALTSTPLLALPDFLQHFTVQTDASGTGIGAILSQSNRPIAFFSKILPPRLQCTSAYNRELCAVVSAILKWRQYLLGHHFIIKTDHLPLKSLLTQTIQTPDQQKWISKLMGFDFEVVYQPGKDNGPADALSRLPEQVLELNAISAPTLGILKALRMFIATNSVAKELYQQIESNPTSKPDFVTRDGLIIFKTRIFVPPDSALQHLIIHEYHDTPIGGHSGIQRTTARISANFYWPNLRKDVTNYIDACSICQQVKSPTTCPQGLLQPLSLPDQVWESISMDFITHLPSSGGKTVIWVVIDRLTKYGHFIALPTKFSAVELASLFVREIYRLHGQPCTIVSDRDKLFMSEFWQELFRLQGTSLATSSAYHPQTDGQTEVLNRCLEDYLRCFVSESGTDWLNHLPWAEWNYNTAWHSAIQMTPFQAVYGRCPPRVLDYLPGSSQVAAVDISLTDRTALLSRLKENIRRAQLRIKQATDRHRLDRQFKIDDWVFLKLQPYRQTSVHRRAGFKLAKRFYGPFKILERIGPVAYRLQLPEDCRIHNVFHVSRLKLCKGDHKAQQASLPPIFNNDKPIHVPEKLLGFRIQLIQGRTVPHLLVQWQLQPPSDATWEPADSLLKTYPSLNLEDKVILDEQGNVTGIQHLDSKEAITIDDLSTKLPKRTSKKPNKLKDFITKF